MRRILLTVGAAVGLLISGCAQKPTIKEAAISQDGLSIAATVSPSRGETGALVGRVVVRNLSSGFVRYGNMHLFLVCSGQKAVTRVRTARADAAGDVVSVEPMADTRMIELAPGDSLLFASYWKFDTRPDFNTNSFSLDYTGQAVAPAPADSAHRSDTIPSTKGLKKEAGKG